MSKMDVEELKQSIPDKKFKKMVRRSRGRVFKNLCIWFAGFLFLPVFIVAVIGIAVGAVPIKTYFGKNASQYVDVSSPESIGNQTALAIGKKIFDDSVGDYKVKDIPALDKALKDLFSGTGLNEYITVDLDAISDLSIDNINGITNSILSCFSISETALGSELGESELFSVSDVGKTAGEIKSEENFNAKLYYYNASGSSTSPFAAKAKSADNSAYKRAFTDNGEFVNGVTTSTPLYYPSLSMIPLGEATDVLVDRIKQIKLTDILSIFTDNNDETGMIFDLLGDKTIASISELSLKDIKLSVLFETPDKKPDNQQLYDILLDITGFTVDGDSVVSEEEQRETAYKNLSLDSFNGINVNNIRIATIIKEEGSETLFSLLKDMSGGKDANEITLSDLTGDNAVNNIKLISVLDDENENNKKLYELLCSATDVEKNDEITIGKLTKDGFNINNIKLTSVLGDENANNKKLYDLLCSATGVEKNDEITIGKLSDGIAIDDVKLSSVLDLPTAENNYKNQKIYDILVTAIEGEKEAKDIVIKDFGSFSVSNIPLSVVLDLPSEDNDNKNKLIYEILVDATGAGSARDITINSLASFNANNIKLSTVLPVEDNDKIYKILVDATGAGSAENITINSLASFKADNIKLSTVLPVEDNDKIYEILVAATEADSAENITINSLASFKADNIKFSTVLSVEGNDKIYSILSQATGKAAEEILISSLSDFKVENITLTTVIEKNDNNEKLFSILKDVTGCAEEDSIKLSDLSSFNVENIKLDGLINAGDNKILTALLNNENLTLGNIGEKINGLKLSDMYGVECFKEDLSGKYYKLKNGGYVLISKYSESTHGERENDKQYNISRDASIWLFMFYNYETGEGNFDTDGNSVYYTESGLTLSELERMSNIAKKLENATIRQLVDSGVIEDPGYRTSTLYAESLSAILGKVANLS